MEIIFKSKINKEFYGFDDNMFFKLDNGQIWIQSRYKYRYMYKYRPNVNILRECGRFYIQVEGMDEVVEVKRAADYIESIIVNDFEGWKGETTFELSNGQIWKQSGYSYRYHYAYRPEVIIYNDGYGYNMKVDGIPNTISVKRVR